MRMGAKSLLGRKFEPIWERFEWWCVFVIHGISDKAKTAMRARSQHSVNVSLFLIRDLSVTCG